MRFSRSWLLAVFAALGSVAFFASRTDAQPETIKEILPGIWFREGDLKNLGHCNNILIDMKDYLILIDANFPSGARATLADVKKVSSKPIKYVFDTHHHGDHSYGNSIFTAAGATTLAYKGVAEEMKRYEPGRWQQAAKERKDVAELNQSTVEPPKQTFDKSPYVISDGSRRVEFYFFGWAHTRGDGFVFLPKEQILCTGDAVVNGPYNFVGDGNIGNWPRVVRAAERLKATRILPAHGGPGGPELLTGQEQFFIELDKAVRAAVKKGQRLEDLVKKEGDKQVATVRLPDNVKNWVGDFYPAQVEGAYKEISQNKPIGEILGGK
ncbi:MAG: MBL fold metallo-hydrolase [Acidobacteria bacterium]|nr:MBL fold metallo-hydrolase [Acidobacteriota bacterium]